MAVANREIESKVNNEQTFRNFLKDSAPEEMCEFILHIEKSGKRSNDFISDMKTLAFMKFETALNINRHYFNTNNAKRFRTELYFEPLDNYKPVLLISVKDSQNEDEMRSRLFDLHKERLLSLLAEREMGAVKS